MLWDKSHEGYKNSQTKFNVWKTFEAELGYDAHEISRKFTALKGQYFRERLKEDTVKTGTAGGERYTSRWFLMNYLSFLSRTRAIRPTVSSDSVQALGQTNRGTIATTPTSVMPPPGSPQHENDIAQHENDIAADEVLVRIILYSSYAEY